MSVTIEEVLAILPEIFPGTQQIPLKNIRPNSKNPGPPLTDPEIQELAQNIAVSGLLNPLKVRPDKANSLVGSVQPHPSDPRLRADGQPWTVGDFNYEILAGENRFRAFEWLKREVIPAFILDPTAKEAVKVTYLDNAVRERGWWAAYQTIEQYIEADPNLTQRQVAVELKMDLEKVNRAIRLLQLLNPEARDLIVRNTNNSNKGIRGISEIAASRLAGLGPDRAFKPGVKAVGAEVQKLWPYPSIPPETQDLVRRALETAIDQELTEAGVKALVGWVQDGHQPEDYGSQKLRADMPVPQKGKYPQPEYQKVPVDRVRISPFWASMPNRPNEIDRKALSMKTTGFVQEIMVRTLLDEERAADPDHDFELFDGNLMFEAAKKLGMPMLPAHVYSGLDEVGALGLLNMLSQVTRCNTWIDVYAAIEKLIEMNPENTVADLVVKLGEDPASANRIFPVMAFLNESARNAIAGSIYQCHEGRTDMGGYRFFKGLAITLVRLGKTSKDLAATQKLVEKVVRCAIENEMGEDEIEGLVDWTLAGKDPREYFFEKS